MHQSNLLLRSHPEQCFNGIGFTPHVRVACEFVLCQLYNGDGVDDDDESWHNTTTQSTSWHTREPCKHTHAHTLTHTLAVADNWCAHARMMCTNRQAQLRWAPFRHLPHKSPPDHVLGYWLYALYSFVWGAVLTLHKMDIQWFITNVYLQFELDMISD